MTELRVKPGDLIAYRLRASSTILIGIVDTANADSVAVRFPAELRGHSLMTAHPITRQPQLSTIPFLFFSLLPLESFAWAELASYHILRDDDLDTRFDYARQVLADYRTNVARWSPEAVGVPTRLLETR